MEQVNNRRGDYLITISNKQYKIVKFTDQNCNIKVQKVFVISRKNTAFINVLKNQFENIQDYLMRRHDLKSRIGVSNYFEIIQKQNPDNLVIKVNTGFSEYPNLNEYYKKQNLNLDTKKEDKNKLYIYYFQEMFSLIVRGGGIDYYFYTPNNVFICPPKKQNLMTLGYLRLNLTSIAGLKVLFGIGSIPKDQFIEIFPCLPPSTFALLKQKSEEALRQLDRLIKIRCFAFLMLTFILRRVPLMLQENFQTLVDPQSQTIRNLVESSPHRMKDLLKVAQVQIQKAEKQTKIDLKMFFSTVFVNCEKTEQINWLWVYETVFQKNLINFRSYQMSDKSNNLNKNNGKYLQDRLIYQNINEQLWKRQKNKQFYEKRMFYLPKRPEKGMVYFMIRINENFHLLAQYLHYIEFFKSDQFSGDGNQIVFKLMKIFNENQGSVTEPNFQNLLKQFQSTQKDVKSLILANGNQIKEQSRQVQNKLQDSTLLPLNLSDLQQINRQNLLNPFFLKNENQVKKISQTVFDGTKETYSFQYPSGAVQLLQNILTYFPNLGQKLQKKQANEVRAQGDSMLKQTNEKTVNIVTMKYDFETLINFTSNLWIQ